MKRRRTILILGALAAGFVPALFSGGCARTPAGTVIVARREVTFQIQFNAPISESYYYFIPIDTAGGGQHPTPVFPTATTGERWVTGAVTHFVRYHQGQYQVYRMKNLDTFESELIGTPVRSDRSDPSALRFTLDLNAIGATGDSVDVDIIAVDQLLAPNRLIDALGQFGTEFLEIGIRTDQAITNTGVETIGDVLDQNQSVQPSNDMTKPLDIRDYRIDVDM